MTKLINTYKSVIVSAFLVLLAACGGGSDTSSGGGSVTTSSSRDARACLDVGDPVGSDAIVVTNTCDAPIIILVFDGGNGNPATIAPNSSANYSVSNLGVLVTFGSCFSPFTPVDQGDLEFDCQ